MFNNFLIQFNKTFLFKVVPDILTSDSDSSDDSDDEIPEVWDLKKYNIQHIWYLFKFFI